MEITLQIVTLALVVVGGTGLWFGFGVKLGNIQKEVTGLKELHQSKLDSVKGEVDELKEDFKGCQKHEREAEEKFGNELAELKTKTAILEVKE